MGKKHKKESKKRRRSRSRSESEDRDIEKDRRKHHKRHHKDKKKERSHKKSRSREGSSASDDGVEFVCETVVKPEKKPTPPPAPKISSPSPPPAPSVSQSVSSATKDWDAPKESLSLSIEETNALRAKLGLKPLQANDSSTPSGELDFVHKPAEDLTLKKETEKLRAKLSERKEKRAIEKKLVAAKTLGEADSDDDVNSWVSKNRVIENQRKLAEKKAKELDEMEEEFGLDDLINQEMLKEKTHVYSTSDIKNLSVRHDINNFHEGRAVILTLEDKGVLDDGEDALVNVNMMDDERYKKNVFNKKLRPYGFNGELEEEEDPLEKKLLSKYDEEIEGEKKKSFKLGEVNTISKETIKSKLVERAKMDLVSLGTTELKLASDYYTEDEMKAKFKKPKKVKKIRRKVLKASDLLELVGDETRPSDLGSRNPKKDAEPMEVDELNTDDTEESAVGHKLENVSIKVEPAEEETELELALKKARRLKQLEKAAPLTAQKVNELIKPELEDDDGGGMAVGNIVLNSTAEFCRTLGDIPTYGLSGNRDDEAQDLLDFEKDVQNESKKSDQPTEQGGWNDAEIDEKLVDIKQQEAPILDAEPDLGAGVAGALRLAVSKGYLEKETSNRPSAARFAHLQAQNYSIEDKTHVDDEKFGRRERYMGPTMDFKEKDTYKPNIKLEYIDDDGRILSAKEAFRYLSHKFHGKGPGKNKVEKRMKKGEQQVLMKQMSSTDTPLGTLQMLQQKQKETQSAFVVLSGSKQQSVPTSIAKAKYK